MLTRKIGSFEVGAIGLGGMWLSLDGRPDENRAIRTVHAALDAGVTLIDTADAYRSRTDETNHNEILIAKALRSYRDDTSNVVVATKGGFQRPADGSWVNNGTPEHLKTAARISARNLGVDSIALYQFHDPDPAVPFEDSIGAFKDLLADGVIQTAGISNVTTDQIRVARDILGEGLVSVQNRYSPAHQDSRSELELAAELGLAFLPWNPLGGIGRSRSIAGVNPAFAEIAAERGISPQQVALAWELSLAPTMIPIPGASRPETIVDSARAVDLRLTDDELTRLGS
ncbi:oxidoreductase [Agromyces luteolus]|uniref:Aldo/keto reductase n=1 Tax=Agromyces luteolus TaxID=88373 RepID=A0A7C9HN36_9MICO|nr:aldo/keto reductase [Agromyces luteolus]MUN08604.1 aldo/keto reductase [Agromyces luteolus]GLK27141.1 oxidoreductase [Agromyces luteolus]